MSLRVGEIVGGRHRVDAVIGGGGFENETEAKELLGAIMGS